MIRKEKRENLKVWCRKLAGEATKIVFLLNLFFYPRMQSKLQQGDAKRKAPGKIMVMNSQLPG
jgi:hypothetical protein